MSQKVDKSGFKCSKWRPALRKMLNVADAELKNIQITILLSSVVAMVGGAGRWSPPLTIGAHHYM